MALRRFYLQNEPWLDGHVVLRGDLFHHIRDVCRFAVGDQFEILRGDGLARLMIIRKIEKKELSAEQLSERPLAPLAKPYLTLALSIPKLPKVDWIVEKCVELGVYEIRPFVSDYSFLRKTSEISTGRMERWQKLVVSATQQSGRGELLKIQAPVTLEHLLGEFNRTSQTGGLFPYEGVAEQDLPSSLGHLKGRNLDHLWVFVGSEGGFSNAEVALFTQAGLPPVSMGSQILRVETACVAIVSVIKYEFGTLR